MKKTIRLTESQLTKLIKRVITESSYEKIENIKNNISKTKDSDCWKKGMCPVQQGEGDIVCEFCPSPIAGILIPTIGAIAGAMTEGMTKGMTGAMAGAMTEEMTGVMTRAMAGRIIGGMPKQRLEQLLHQRPNEWLEE